MLLWVYSSAAEVSRRLSSQDQASCSLMKSGSWNAADSPFSLFHWTALREEEKRILAVWADLSTWACEVTLLHRISLWDQQITANQFTATVITPGVRNQKRQFIWHLTIKDEMEIMYYVPDSVSAPVTKHNIICKTCSIWVQVYCMGQTDLQLPFDLVQETSWFVITLLEKRVLKGFFGCPHRTQNHHAYPYPYPHMQSKPALAFWGP